MLNKANLLNSLKEIQRNSIDAPVVLEAIQSIPTPEMELAMMIEKQRKRQLSTVKNINFVDNNKKVVDEPIPVAVESEPVKTDITIDKLYLDMLKGNK